MMKSGPSVADFHELPAMHRSGYIPEIDGLRAVAILSIIVYHLVPSGVPFGWAGVNLFFVISGFLITGILLDTRANANFFRTFYIRRALRIFPIYYLTLFATLTIGTWVYSDSSGLWYCVLYLQNIMPFLHAPPVPHLLGHTWSLAVEEQFYLIWPIVIYLAGRRWLLPVILGTLLLGPAWRLFMFAGTGNYLIIYITTPGQLDALGIGALLALAIRTGAPWVKWLTRYSVWAIPICAGALGVLVLRTGLSTFVYQEYYFYGRVNLLVPTLLAIIFGSVLINVVTRVSLVSSVLQNSGLRHIGKISYGLYMYHSPIFKMLDGLTRLGMIDLGLVGLSLLKLALAYAAARLSWDLLEQRIITLKERYARQPNSPWALDSGGDVRSRAASLDSTIG